ncbi:glycosyltransferase [Priestia megaterium]|uniref:glycosyltransferase n=1 Tax=Priestia megaterium TaxID=1404 RepID=UPI002B24B134|nr:glycosyltransferase [Priestia megaterium]MEB2265695.1 glycosyltransferase [Priestia megaterium]
MKRKVMLLMTGLYYGGMERVVFIAQSLIKKEYDVTVVTLYAKDADYEPDFEYIDLNCPPKGGKISKSLNVLKRVSKVRKIKNKIKPDIVMSFGTSANFANVLSKGKEKVVVGIRSYDWLTNYFVNYSIDRWTYNRADRVVSVSKLIAQDAERIFTLSKEKSKVLYNPYDVDFICKKAEEHLDEINLPNTDKLIISVGRLVNQKGFNHLIKAFSLVIQNHPDAHLMIVGHGEKEDELRKLILNLGIQDNVILTGGQSNPYKFMKNANLYALSSVTEGFPNAMVEAMSIGLPILAVDCKSGPREILSTLDSNNSTYRNKGLEKCDYGVISMESSKSFDYNADNIEKCDQVLAEGIDKFLSSESLRKEYSIKSRKRAQEFTYDRFKSSLLNILNEL